jgi:hypothetical protein
MSHKSAPTTVSTIGIDLGKNSFHLVGLDQRGATVRGAASIQSLLRVKRTFAAATAGSRPALMTHLRHHRAIFAVMHNAALW